MIRFWQEDSRLLGTGIQKSVAGVLPLGQQPKIKDSDHEIRNTSSKSHFFQ